MNSNIRQKSKYKLLTKLIVLLLCLVLMTPMLIGCADFFFDRQVQRDREQVVASIPVATQIMDGKTFFDARSIDIRKGSLIQEFNSIAPQLVQEGMSVKDTVGRALENLVVKEIESLYIDIEFAKGKFFATDADKVDKEDYFLEWRPFVRDDDGYKKIGPDGYPLIDYTNDNVVLRNVYSALQVEIFKIADEILQESGSEKRPDTTQTDPQDPPFKVPPQEEPEKVPETTLFEPSFYPGDNHESENASLDRKAFRRLIDTFSSNIDLDFRLSDKQRDSQKAELKAILDIIREADSQDSSVARNQKYREAYLYMGNNLIEDINNLDSPGNSVLYWIAGQAAFRQQQKDVFQANVKDQILVRELDIQSEYNRLLNLQQSFTNTKFVESVDNGDLILFEPNNVEANRYFFVKHILLPFSDSQKVELKAILSSSTSTAEKELARERLSLDIRVKPRQNGYEVGQGLSPRQIFDEISSRMIPLIGNPQSASRVFDEFIYKYNGDPGIFDKLERGYLVQPFKNNSDSKPGDDDYGLDKQWVVEFAKAARSLRADYDNRNLDGSSVVSSNPLYNGVNLQNSLGTISQMVVTDNGVHILYLSDVVNGRVRNLADRVSAGSDKTVREAIRNKLFNEMTGNYFDNWLIQIVSTHLSNSETRLKTFESRYSDMW
ncbi:MAG: hypothetical protein LBU60_04625 [Clostridiales bacterium]|nr:hypothetical protein [Clostridiales bacterium]